MRRLLEPDATDENWEYYGKKCPYFGVFSKQQFRPEEINEESKREFFLSGEKYISRLFDCICQTVQPDFQPRRALDFGCGVGRLVIPLSKRARSVVGVDVSPSMLAEAERNCAAHSASNVSFCSSLNDIVESPEGFDFVHSYIVFQHIRPERGIPLFEKMVSLLQRGGVGAVHFTYASPQGRRDRLRHWLYRKIPLFYGIAQVARGRNFAEPLMDMAEYSLNRIFSVLQDSDCHACHVRFTRHGVRGVTIIFRKSVLEEL